MVYVPNQYVFLVGGTGVKNVECYNTQTKELRNHSQLVEERTEPALALLNNSYLYAFSFASGKKPVETFERINLRGSKNTWDVIKPKLEIGVEKFSQRFFAVSHHRQGEVIFIGGLAGENNKHDYLYDYKTDTIKKSENTHKNFEFQEKFFYPLGEGNYFLIPNIERENISILRYTVEDKVKAISFEADSDISIMNDPNPYNHNEFTLFSEDTKRDQPVTKVSTTGATTTNNQPTNTTGQTTTQTPNTNTTTTNQQTTPTNPQTTTTTTTNQQNTTTNQGTQNPNTGGTANPNTTTTHTHEVKTGGEIKVDTSGVKNLVNQVNQNANAGISVGGVNAGVKLGVSL